ncbi:PA2778 family cysteine peptidase [Piscinibacter sakaiensis]|uniref:Peptidase C39-like domain-containing protein n=1 Tax=Piscinibacter sakaiensis TaxID=1547922 RepID=A0A0K8P6C7_PISS1|nr:PA2778 family cysteine peptidase [Piscinibacter sakaiensis]GAP38253.1 hypothetical protein ISF6_4447 [Piscinibacter sakaiensis]
MTADAPPRADRRRLLGRGLATAAWPLSAAVPGGSALARWALSPAPRALAALAAAAAAAGCASRGPGLLEALPGELPGAVDLEERVPHFPQTAYQCGPAALATVLGAAGVDTTPQALAPQVYLPAREGSLQLELLAAARRQGLVATRLPPRVPALLAALAEGRPVVVLQNLGLDLAPVWHYAVLVAYDLQGAGEVVLRSGLVRRLPLVLPLFENTWVRAGSWAMVVTPPGTWPSGAEEPAALEAAVGFERVAGPALALRAYAAAVQRWPDSLGLRVGLGNAAFASGQKALAADAFQTAAQRHRSAPAWINLGHTLLDAGLVDAAWRVALEAEYLNDPAFRAETTALLREVYGRRLARGDAGTKDSSAPR